MAMTAAKMATMVPVRLRRRRAMMTWLVLIRPVMFTSSSR